MECLKAVAADLGLLGAAWICGRPATCLGDMRLDAGERAALRLLTGVGALGLGLFLIGQIYFTRALGIGVVVAGWAAVLLPGFRADLAAVVRTFAGGWAGLISLAVIAFLLMAGLAEPVGDMGADGISYHLLGPKVWLREGRIGVVLDHFHTSFPATIETLFGVVMGAAGPRAAGALGVAWVGLFSLQVHGLACLLGGAKAGRLAMAAVISIPMISSLALSEFVDLPFAAFAIAAFRVGQAATRAGHLLLAGCFLGACAGTKYTGLVTIAVTLPILAAGLARPGGRRLIPALLWAGLASLLVACPWYLRNWVRLGSPIYPPPVLGKFFKPRAMPPESVRDFLRYVHDERGRGLGRSAADFLLLPFRFTYFTSWFHGAGGIGLLPLGFGGLGLWLTRRRPAARLLAAWAMLLTAAWFITDQEARFLIHAVAAAVVFGAVGATASQGGGRLLRALSAAVISVSLGYGAAFLVVERRGDVRAVFSPGFAAERHRRGVPYSGAFAYLNRADSVTSVLILDPRVPPYYLNRPYVKPLGAYGVFPIEGVRTPRDAAREARRLGASHVLDIRVPADAPGGPIGFVVGPEDGFTLVFEADDARIYSLR